MKILFKHILGNILSSYKKSLLFIVSLTVTGLILYLNLGVKAGLIEQYYDMYNSTFNGHHIKVDMPTKDKGYFQEEAIIMPDNNNLSGFSLTRLDTMMLNNSDSINMTIYGTDLEYLVDEELLIYTENLEGSTDYLPLIISGNTADLYQLRQGDIVEVNTLSGEFQAQILGIAAIDGLYLQEKGRIMCFTGMESLWEVEPSTKPYISAYYMKSDKRYHSEDLINGVKELNPNVRVINLLDEKAIESSVNKISQLLTIVLIIVSLMAFYLNLNIGRLLMEDRIPKIATLRSIGATKPFTKLLVVIENSLYALIASVLAIVIGVSTKGIVLEGFSVYVSSDKRATGELSFDLTSSILVVIFLVAVQLLVTLLVWIRINSFTIKTLLFNTRDTAIQISFKQTVIGFCFIGVSVLLYVINEKNFLVIGILTFICGFIGIIQVLPFLIVKLVDIMGTFSKSRNYLPHFALMQVKSNKMLHSSIRLIVLTVTMMVILYMSITSINTKFDALKKGFEGDIQLTRLTQDYDQYKEYITMDYIDEMIPSFYHYTTIDIGNGPTELGVFGMRYNQFGIESFETEVSHLSWDELLVDEIVALEQHINIGDQLDLSEINQSLNQLVVKGFINSSSFNTNRNMLVLNQETYMEYISSKPISLQAYVNIPVEEAVKKMMYDLAGTGIAIESIDSFLASKKAGIDEMIMMLVILFAMAFVLAVLGIITNQLIGFEQRKKHLAVLYSVSMSRSELKKMIVFELGIGIGIACFISSLASIYMVSVFEKVLYGIKEYINIPIKLDQLVMVVMVLFFGAMLTNLFSLGKVNRLNILSTIKYE